MKLLNTIKKLVKEAEENYYRASQNSDNPKEIQMMEKKLEDSIRLLQMYQKMEKED